MEKVVYPLVALAVIAFVGRMLYNLVRKPNKNDECESCGHEKMMVLGEHKSCINVNCKDCGF